MLPLHLGIFSKSWRDERPTQPRLDQLLSSSLDPLSRSRPVLTWILKGGKKGIDKWRAKEQRNLADLPAVTYRNKLLRIVVVVVAAREGRRRRWEGDGSIGWKGRGWILPAFNSSRSVYLLISSGLERRIATPCQMFFSRVFLLRGCGGDVFQQLCRRIINGFLSCWGRGGWGCVRIDGFGVASSSPWVME